MTRKDPTNWIYVGLPQELIEQIDRHVEEDHKPLGRWHSRADLIISFLNHDLVNYEYKLAMMENKNIEEECRQKMKALKLIP